ncbi:MAG: NTP transferase domain-containing protein [Candidatus Delongbacteria bacterium]|jgi:bifunctional UDP-N-acetylglucosamine pyrophosphorylase/glucosamine-1-phosphate N-acetyltransferase|nr:NTP transferase domain-containing protein [Candidatus Delongbacteria bacterium]
MNKLYTLILAAGKGTRMKSDLPKVIHKIDGKELVKYVIKQAKDVGSEEIWVITGHKGNLVREATADDNVFYVEQKEMLGTGHAVMQAEDVLKEKDGDVLILCGDVPVLKGETLAKFRDFHISSGSVATVMTTKFDNPFGYGRIITNDKGEILKIVEQKDASEEERKVKEINSGVYIINLKDLFSSLDSITSDNAGNEYYLTDVISILKNKGKKVLTYLIEDNSEILGINTIEQLKEAESIILSRK